MIQKIPTYLRAAGFDVRVSGHKITVSLNRDVSLLEVWCAAHSEYDYDVARKVGKKVVIDLSGVDQQNRISTPQPQ